MTQQSVWDWRSSTLAAMTGGCFLLGLIWWLAADTVFALGVCFGAVWILRQIRYTQPPSLQFIVCTITLSLALLGAIGSLIPITVVTTTQYGESGEVINIINYPITYFAFRICTMSALLGLSISLTLARSIRQRQHRMFAFLILAQAVVSFVLYLGAVFDIYLDATLPSPLLGPLVWLWALSWFALALSLLVPRHIGRRQRKAIS